MESLSSGGLLKGAGFPSVWDDLNGTMPESREGLVCVWSGVRWCLALTPFSLLVL